MAKTKKQKLKIIPLGGIGEIGKNITVVEYGDDIIVIDCGLGFPDDDMLGIDLVIPDTSYLEKNADRVRGILLTHGHLDHTAALGDLCDRQNCKVWIHKNDEIFLNDDTLRAPASLPEPH